MILSSFFCQLLATALIISVSGYQMYNNNTEVCCGGNVSTKATPSTSCCGSRLYDAAKKFCCLGKNTYDRKFDRACCGDGYGDNASKELCCHIPGEVNVYPVSNKTECCGKIHYSFRDEMCCDGKLLPKPKALKPNEQGICCAGTIINNERQKCCGNVTLDIRSDRVCCMEARKWFDPRTQACCGFAVVDLSREEIANLPDKGTCCVTSYAVSRYHRGFMGSGLSSLDWFAFS